MMAPDVRRVRFEDARFRLLEVARVEDVTPHYRRLTMRGDLAGFSTEDASDHLKVVIPAAGQTTLLAMVDGQWPDDQPRPIMRDYTPRTWDSEAGELTIDFALRSGVSGPVTSWAAQAEAGQPVGIAGPRSSQVVDLYGVDWLLLVGDETALPSIGRRLEALPAGIRAFTFIEVGGPADEQPIRSAADAEIVWLHRGLAAPGTTAVLESALRNFAFPDGEYYGWFMGNADNLRDIRRYLFSERGVVRERTRFTGHWKVDYANFDHHSPIEE